MCLPVRTSAHQVCPQAFHSSRLVLTASCAAGQSLTAERQKTGLIAAFRPTPIPSNCSPALPQQNHPNPGPTAQLMAPHSLDTSALVDLLLPGVLREVPPQPGPTSSTPRVSHNPRLPALRTVPVAACITTGSAAPFPGKPSPRQQLGIAGTADVAAGSSLEPRWGRRCCSSDTSQRPPPRTALRRTLSRGCSRMVASRSSPTRTASPSRRQQKRRAALSGMTAEQMEQEGLFDLPVQARSS